MHPLIGLAQLLFIGFGLYLVTLIIYTMWGLTHPHRQTYASALAKNLPGDPSELSPPIEFQEQRINGTRGDLHIWIIQGKAPDGPRVVFTHGWGSSRQGGLKRLEPFLKHASQIVLWDLPGHGDSDGIARLGSSEHEDLQRVLETTLDPCSTSEQSTVLYGWSMGSGVSLRAAADWGEDAQLIAVICESPYINPITPARNVIRLRGIPHRLNLKPTIWGLGLRFGLGVNWRGFARDQIAASLDVPILVLHGTDDPVCPTEDAQRVADSASNGQLQLIEGAGHNNLWTDDEYSEQMNRAIESFLVERKQANGRSGDSTTSQSQTQACQTSQSESPVRP
jgi:uncharacterized protein